MIEVGVVKAALENHIPRSLLEQDEMLLDYLESLLVESDADDELETLVDAVQPFLEDNRDLANTLVRAIYNNADKKEKEPANLATTATSTRPEQEQTKELLLPPQVDHTSDNSHHDHHDDALSITDDSSQEGHTRDKAKNPAARRKEQRRQRKQQQQRHKTNPKNSSNNNDDNLHTVVARLNTIGAQELNEMDDYASAWNDVRAKANNNNGQDQDVVWGGRGKGGRGVNRGLGVYRGKDAVVNQLTLSYGGQELLHETHLAIAHGHRYGLMGPNGVGKSTLLRRIATGSVPGWPLHLSVKMVEQEVLGTPQSILDCMKEVSQHGGRGGRAQKRIDLQEHAAFLEAILEDTNADADSLETAAEQLSVIYEQLDEMDAEENSSDDEAGDKTKGFGSLDARARTILKGLQFKQDMLETQGSLLSGGWRMRLALAQALYSEPDILLLDEPTNHLDLSAIMFLEQWIVDKNLTVVVVSHDGHFLDSICTDMIKFENGKLKYHVGNYSSFRESEEQMWTRNTNKAEAVTRKEKKAKEFIQKQRSMANSKHRDDNKQRQAAERQKKLGRIGLFSDNGQKFKLLAEGNTKKGGSNRAGHIFGNYTNSAGFQSAFVSNEQVAFGEQQQLLNFKFPAAPPLKGGGSGSNLPLITMEDCCFRYEIADDKKQWLLQDMSLNVSYDSRISIVGKNGAGKSTLLKLLCGELTVDSGEFHRHPNLKIAHIAQHHIEHLGAFLESTPVDYFMQQHHAKNEQEARQFLGGFGLVGNLALQLIGTLSGGQKARLAFATVMYTEPHVLILDEPTNHLDRDSLESLAVAVETFQGAVVIVSHNQDFMSRCTNEMWTVADGRVKVEIADGEIVTFDDLFEKYKNKLKQELKTKRR